MRVPWWVVMLGLPACASPGADEPWTLVWQDEFGGPEDAPPNPDTWSFDVGGAGWGNGQLEYDTDRPDNVSLNGNGFLRIRARREAYEGNAWTSGRIRTEGSLAYAYGKIEARIWLPSGKGIWPAFWMLGDDFAEVGWPSCGEIDVVEMRGEAPDVVFGTIHGPGYSGGEGISNELPLEDGAYSDAFHVYGVVWDPDNIVWTVDDRILATLTPADLPADHPWVFDHPFFFLLNVAVGGSVVEEPDDTTPDLSVMAVDYVRVYQRTSPLAP